MSKRDDKIEQYIKNSNELNLNIDKDLIEKVTIALGPSIYNKDSETVACADKSELERVRENFLKKKLALTNSDEELDSAIKEVCEKMGKSNKNKYRALFYALLVDKFNKSNIYA